MIAAELVNNYLGALYLKTKNDIAKGYNVYIIAKLIGLDDEQADFVKEYLQRNGLIENLVSNDDPITILSPVGLDYTLKLRENRMFKTIRFTRCQYLPPEGMPGYNFIYSYTLVHEDGKEERNAIKVSISDVLSLVWRCSYEELRKVLCQFAKDRIIEKLKYGILKKSTEIVLLRSNNPDKCPYDAQNLIDPVLAEYEIEIEKKLLTEKADKDSFMHH